MTEKHLWSQTKTLVLLIKRLPFNHLTTYVFPVKIKHNKEDELNESEESRSRIRLKIGDVEFEVEGKESMVKEFYEKFKTEDFDKLSKQIPKTPPTKPIEPSLEPKGEPGKPKPKLKSPAASKIKTKLLTAFKRKLADLEKEWVLLFAYWLGEIKSKEFFSWQDIKDTYIEIGRKERTKIGNITNNINTCIDAGWFVIEEAELYRLTDEGKDKAIEIINRTQPPVTKSTSRKKKKEARK